MFLLQAMNALKKYNPLTESFLVQLEVDLEGCGINMPMTETQARMSSMAVSFQDIFV